MLHSNSLVSSVLISNFLSNIFQLLPKRVRQNDHAVFWPLCSLMGYMQMTLWSNIVSIFWITPLVIVIEFATIIGYLLDLGRGFVPRLPVSYSIITLRALLVPAILTQWVIG